MGANPGGGGGGQGDMSPPHVFFRWGTQYQMSPPPPRFCGWMNIRRYNDNFNCLYGILAVCFLDVFFFCVLVRKVCDVG